MNYIIIEGLNMRTVNDLIWSSAILAKVGLIIVAIYGLIIIGTVITALLD